MSRRRRPSWLVPLLVVVLVVVVVSVFLQLVLTQRLVVPRLSGAIFPIQYRDGIARVADTYDVDPYLIAAVVRTESGYDPRAVSHAGAVGLMQLMPATAEWITKLDGWRGKDDPVLTDPEDNLELGACYLAFLSRQFGKGQRAAVAAYNAGQNIVAQWVETAHGRTLGLGDIPFEETRTFVQRVERALDFYQRAHPGIFAGEASPADTSKQ